MPSERAHIDVNADVLDFSWIAERIATPAVVIGSNARSEAHRGHRRQRREDNERAAAIVRRSHEPDDIGVGRLGAGKDDEPEAAGAEQLVGRAEGMHPAPRADEQRPVVPERPGDRARAIDPRRAFSAGNDVLTGGAEDCRRSAVRLADGELAEGEAAAGEGAVELGETGGDQPRGLVRYGDGIGEALLEEGAEGGEGHSRKSEAGRRKTEGSRKGCWGLGEHPIGRWEIYRTKTESKSTTVARMPAHAMRVLLI